MCTNEYREAFVNYLDEQISTCRISKKSLGHLFRAYHMACPVLMLILLAYAPKPLAYLMIFSYIVIIVLFFHFGGCFLSCLEDRIFEDDFNIADPFLELMGKEINTKNRFHVTYYVGLQYTVIFCAVAYWRFF